MSVTLTDRDTTTYVLTPGSSSANETAYAVAGGSLGDYRLAKARHSNMGVVDRNSRHNFRFERLKINTASQKLRSLSVDITISVPNDNTFSSDDIDDVVTGAASYFASEADTGNFVIGLNRT